MEDLETRLQLLQNLDSFPLDDFSRDGAANAKAVGMIDFWEKRETNSRMADIWKSATGKWYQ
jgi:hypothetical protein